MVTGVLVVSIGYQASFLTIAALLLVGTALFWFVAVPDPSEAAVTKLV
jgi:hypothetical protein